MAGENQPARSTSENSCRLPVLGGHSIVNMLLLTRRASMLPGTIHARRTLLPYFTVPSSIGSPAGGSKPVSSLNSRCAATQASSSSKYSPFGMDHALSSFFAQNGPPGWTSNSSILLACLRYSTMPALSLGITGFALSVQLMRFDIHRNLRRDITDCVATTNSRRASFGQTAINECVARLHVHVKAPQ